MKCRTPAQKRRRDFKTQEDWARWACNVLIGNRGEIEVNTYSWKTGTSDLLRGLQRAQKLGWAKCLGGHPASKVYAITDAGREARKKIGGAK